MKIYFACFLIDIWYISQVDSVIDICSDVMNLRSVSYECKCKLEETKDDYKIEVRSEMVIVRLFAPQQMFTSKT